MNELQRRQHRVDVACGYALGAYLGVSLSWLGMLLNIDGLTFLALLVATFAGFFGSLRTLLGLPVRFWLLPVGSLGYVVGVLACAYYDTIVLAAATGVTYSIVFAPLVHKLYKNDFAQTIPPWVCGGCGYTLLGLSEPTCPECGQRFDPEDVPKLSEMPREKADRLQ